MSSSRALFVSLVLVTGCGLPCDPGSSCPTPVSVRGQCMGSETCSMGATKQWCVTGDCKIQRGQTLTVPLTGVALAKTQQLFVDYRTTSASAPDPIHVDAELDGQKGTTARFDAGSSSRAAVVTWDPFPAGPKELTVRFDDGSLTFVDPNLEFEDAPCEEKAASSCASP